MSFQLIINVFKELMRQFLSHGKSLPSRIRWATCQALHSLASSSFSGGQQCKPQHSGQGSLLESKPGQGLAGGPVVKSPPATAGDTGLIPGLGRSRMATERLSLCATTPEPTRTCAPHQEKPLQGEAHEPQPEVISTRCN